MTYTKYASRKEGGGELTSIQDTKTRTLQKKKKKKKKKKKTIQTTQGSTEQK